MIVVRQIANRSSLSFCLFFAVLFTFSACSQPEARSAAPHPLSLTSLHLQGESRCTQPPSQVNLQTATNQQLASWGFPSHETLVSTLTQATNLMQLKHRVCSSGTSKQAKTKLPLTNQVNHTNDLVTSENWGGYVAQGDRGTFTEVNMYVTVPTLTGTPGVADSAVSYWVGVGAAANTSPAELVQAGISSDVDPSSNQTNYAFWEVVGDGLSNAAQPLSLTINPGDQIWEYVSSNADGDGYDGFLVQDITQGTYQTAYESDPNSFSDSASAECIIERPEVDTGFRPLANFGTISVTGCGAYVNGQGGMAPLGNFSPNQFNLANAASPNPLNNGSDFTVEWEGNGN